MKQRKQKAGGKVKPCSLEPELTNLTSLKKPELKAILNIYSDLYQTWKISVPISSIIGRRHVIRAMSILCRFLESDTYQEIENRSYWFKNNIDYLAAVALKLAANIEEDVPYNPQSYSRIFKINLRKLNSIEALIWEALDNNLLILEDQQWVWDNVIPKNIYPN
jgi:hypothetical protein